MFWKERHMHGDSFPTQESNGLTWCSLLLRSNWMKASHIDLNGILTAFMRSCGSLQSNQTKTGNHRQRFTTKTHTTSFKTCTTKDECCVNLHYTLCKHCWKAPFYTNSVLSILLTDHTLHPCKYNRTKIWRLACTCVADNAPCTAPSSARHIGNTDKICKHGRLQSASYVYAHCTAVAGRTRNVLIQRMRHCWPRWNLHNHGIDLPKATFAQKKNYMFQRRNYTIKRYLGFNNGQLWASVSVLWIWDASSLFELLWASTVCEHPALVCMSYATWNYGCYGMVWSLTHLSDTSECSSIMTNMP